METKGIIQSSITARQRHCCSRLQCYRLVGVTLHCRCEKSAPFAMRLFIKTLLTTCLWNYNTVVNYWPQNNNKMTFYWS